MSKITDLLIEYKKILQLQLAAAAAAEEEEAPRKDFLNRENLTALEQALLALNTSFELQEDTQENITEDQLAFDKLQTMLIDGHANLVAQSEGGGASASASSAAASAPLAALAPSLSRQVSTNLANMSEALSLRSFSLAAGEEKQEKQEEQEGQEEQDDAMDMGFAGGAGAAAAAPVPGLYPGAMMPPPPPVPSWGSLRSAAAPAGAAAAGLYPGASAASMPPPPPVPPSLGFLGSAAGLGGASASAAAASFAAPGSHRNLSAAPVAAANPVDSALSSDSDEEEESQDPVPPPEPLQRQIVRKRRATHFDANPPAYISSELNTPARYTQAWLRQAARILSKALPEKLQVADLLFSHLSNNRVGVSDTNAYVFDILKFAASDIEGILKEAMQKSSEYGARFLPNEVGFASLVNLIVPNLQKVLLSGWTNERATAAQVVSNDPIWLKRKFFKLHLKFLNEALQAVAMLFPDENLAELTQVPQLDDLLEQAGNSIGLSQEQIEQYKTTRGCAEVEIFATELAALISLEQDNASDERLSLRLNRASQQYLLQAGASSYYRESSLSNYLVCLDQQSVYSVLEAKVLPKLSSGDIDGLPRVYAPAELDENKASLKMLNTLKSHFVGGLPAQVSVSGRRFVENEKTVFLLLDLSGSMGGGNYFNYNQNANAGIETSMSILKRSLRKTIEELGGDENVSIIGFESQAHNLTDGLEKASDLKQPDRLEAVIARCIPMGGTDINCAFNRVSEQIRDIKDDYDPNRTMVFFLTDGEFNYGDLANIRSNFERETGLVGAYPLVVGLGINSGANLTQVQQVVEQFNLVEGSVSQQISTQADIPINQLFVLSDTSGNMDQYFDTILAAFSELSFEFWRGEINVTLGGQGLDALDIELDDLTIDLDELAKLLPFATLVEGGLEGVENVRVKVNFGLQGGAAAAESSVEITPEQLDLLFVELVSEYSRLEEVEKRTLAPVIARLVENIAQNARSIECIKGAATGKRPSMGMGGPALRGLGGGAYSSVTMEFGGGAGASMPMLRRQSTASAAAPGLRMASEGFVGASQGL